MLVTSLTLTIKLNLTIIQASQFFQQFKLDIWHKIKKKHIIPNALSCLASANRPPTKLQHLELNALFAYNTTLIQINLMLVF